MTLSQYVSENYSKAVRMILPEWLNRNPLPVIAERKIDGRRAFFFKSKNAMCLATKHNGTYTSKMFPELFAKFGMTRFQAVYVTLDGEFMPPDRYYAFDILSANMIDYKLRPLWIRKQLLTKALGCEGNNTSEFLLPYKTLHSEAEIIAYRQEAINFGYEGIMVKNPMSYYGQANSWLKWKKEETVDVIILDEDTTTPEYQRTGVVHSWFIGLYDDTGTLRECGKVGSYVKEVNPALIKKGVIVEVKFQEITENFRLRNPFIIRIRKDKIPQECLIEQVKP